MILKKFLQFSKSIPDEKKHDEKKKGNECNGFPFVFLCIRFLHIFVTVVVKAQLFFQALHILEWL